MISIEKINKNFGTVQALKDVSLEIGNGKKVVIIGPSGSGKSTLIRCINGLEKPTSGKIIVDGLEATAPKADMRRLCHDVAMVFQNFNLYPHKTVLENVTLAPIKVLKIPRDKAVENGKLYLERVGLSDKLDTFPAKLSGGQQQRVAIARALNMNPKIILFDEPTSALDPEMIGEVADVIADLAKGNKTLVIVTHEMGLAREVADELVFMDEGSIVERGTPAQLFDQSPNPRLRAFFSKVLK
ncbi:amino acid ABC transporter ATP-binding protein [Eubacterium limosum]|uniref:Amino acid ABC transporter ATP-binding protein n=1 Tax=Eubacterium limosum TaxID=1736 RepID=A0ABT5UX86_EUBLI|nr:amino acid ABC transporter ATP-binding protein [Eubacterium limosum]MCB6571626.1 amino acid ABC transporter ATP-binding protein [Eubacterium limosum]MDE1472446.1 amino acid ABC transporter ATP-binding protein [Eubacterium limosum]